jgi:glycerophosphoryl diester phosphodiesterase
MKQVHLLYLLLFIMAAGCSKEDEPEPADLAWDLFESPDAVALLSPARTNMEGVYTLTSGADRFGTQAAAKWTYDINGADTTFYVSFFCEKDISHIICRGKRLDSTILLYGHWRAMVGTETGTVRLQISETEGAQLLLTGDTITPASIIIQGVYGIGNEVPVTSLTLTYQRPVYNTSPYLIVAHRGGGRNANLLPASENSLEVLKLSSRYGANGVEIDVRLTSDHVPILYHDETLNERSIQPNGMMGPIVNYSYAQLNGLVRLINGERIPTLRQALETIIFQTPLQFVWLDIKDVNSMHAVRSLQAELQGRADAIDRHVVIMIGLTEDAIDAFMTLPAYTQVPSVCEVLSKVNQVNAKVWGASWSEGLQTAEVNQMHAQGRSVIAWTVNEPQYITQFMTEGNFDGLLSDYPSEIAYQYYARR